MQRVMAMMPNAKSGAMRYASLLLALPLLALLALPVAAEEAAVRPWGRLGGSAVTKPTDGNSGYLGRYNPWNKETDTHSENSPRYRERDSDNRGRGDRGSYRKYGAVEAPAPHPYTPYSPAYPYGYGAMGGYPYSDPYFSPMQGLAPWRGGLNPDYGNYWNDPYDALYPDRGSFWSDMGMGRR